MINQTDWKADFVIAFPVHPYFTNPIKDLEF